MRVRNIQRAPCVSSSSPLISAQMSRHSCFFSNQFHAEDQAPALIWTLPHLDFTSSGLLQNLIPFQLFHLEGSANGDLFDGLSFLKRKKPDLHEQSTVAYVWRDYITPCTMNAMGIWCVLWLVAFALTSAAPKSHKRLLENTNEQKDTLQVEKDNQENILSQVRISSPALDSIISVQLLY